MTKTSEKAKLKFGEIKKLQKILDKSHEIHGKGNFPTITVEPTKLIKVIWTFRTGKRAHKNKKSTIGALLVKNSGQRVYKSGGQENLFNNLISLFYC